MVSSRNRSNIPESIAQVHDAGLSSSSLTNATKQEADFQAKLENFGKKEIRVS